MVNNKSRPLQWPIINSAPCTGSHTGRCLNKGLESNLEWYINRENVVSPGNEIPHQYSRVIRSKTSNTDIRKIQGCQSNQSSNRQHCGLNISDENGRYSKQDSTTSGLDGYRLRPQEERVSKVTSDLISKSRWPNCNAKWASWCYRRKTDSFSSNVNEILYYLAYLCEQELQYRTINN